VYDQLKSRLAALLARARPMKPQTERQMAHYLAEHRSGPAAFLRCAASVLEDYELETFFGPLFTPTLDDRIELADLLYHWRPTEAQLHQLVTELTVDVPSATVRLPDGADAPLTLHEVLVERFVRLLRLDAGPDPATAAALREVLPPDLWPVAVALAGERGMTPRHQAWFASFVSHAAGRHALTRELLESAADFVASQPDLAPPAVAAAAEALVRATQGTAAYAAGGHAYWSPDVAQHHQYRGQGNVDRDGLARRQAELERVRVLADDVRTFAGAGGE
jgi:hypothetical protein